MRRRILGGNKGGEILPLSLSHIATTSTNLTISTTDGNPIDVTWADGSQTTQNNGIATTKTYASSIAGNISILTPERILGIYSSVNSFNFDLVVLKEYTNISILDFQGNNTITGNLSNTPTGLTSMLFTGSNTITGNLSGLPSGLTYMYFTGGNTISGNIGSAPSGLTQMYLQGNNTITGDIATAPAGLSTIYVQGNNTISGSINNAPAGLTYLRVIGQNTISGNINNAPANLTYILLDGKNTVTGNLAGAPAGLTEIYLHGLNTISDYTAGRTWANNQRDIYFRPNVGSGLSSSEIDNLLIDYANVATWTGLRRIDVRGNNASRTTASNAAVTTLQGKGVNVLTN